MRNYTSESISTCYTLCSITQKVCESWKESSYLANLVTDPQGHRSSFISMVKVCEDILFDINKHAPNLKWDENDENDPFAKDILGARLRAKFYGARVITYRDFVLKVLRHSSERANQDQQNSNNPTTGEAPASSAGPDINPITIQYAELCIKALIKSTRAFYGVGDPTTARLIVTNIWGTAHAYVF